jgi:chromosomal replication initiation ATPase DnaA
MTISRLRELIEHMPADAEISGVDMHRGLVLVRSGDEALLAKVVHHASEVFGVTEAEILGRAKPWPIVSARHAVAYVLRTLGLSSSSAGRLMGRDPGNVLNATKVCLNVMQTDMDYRTKVMELWRRMAL